MAITLVVGKVKKENMINNLPKVHNVARTSNDAPNSSQSSRTSSIKHFKFLGYGHIASNCPTKTTMTLNPKGEIKSEQFSPPSPKCTSSHTYSSSSSEDEIKPSEGGLLVVRCMLGQVPYKVSYQ